MTTSSVVREHQGGHETRTVRRPFNSAQHEGFIPLGGYRNDCCLRVEGHTMSPHKGPRWLRWGEVGWPRRAGPRPVVRCSLVPRTNGLSAIATWRIRTRGTRGKASRPLAGLAIAPDCLARRDGFLRVMIGGRREGAAGCVARNEEETHRCGTRAQRVLIRLQVLARDAGAWLWAGRNDSL